MAVILSLFFVGLGQIYNGQTGKGVVLIALGTICGLGSLFTITSEFGTALMLCYLLISTYSLYDAYSTAKKINADETRKEQKTL